MELKKITWMKRMDLLNVDVGMANSLSEKKGSL